MNTEDLLKFEKKEKCWSHYIYKDLEHNLDFSIWYNKDGSISIGVASFEFKGESDSVKYTGDVNYGQVVTLGMLINNLKIPRKDILKEIELRTCIICKKEFMLCEVNGLSCYGCKKYLVCSDKCLKKHWKKCSEYKQAIKELE